MIINFLISEESVKNVLGKIINSVRIGHRNLNVAEVIISA